MTSDDLKNSLIEGPFPLSSGGAMSHDGPLSEAMSSIEMGQKVVSPKSAAAPPSSYFSQMKLQSLVPKGEKKSSSFFAPKNLNTVRSKDELRQGNEIDSKSDDNSREDESRRGPKAGFSFWTLWGREEDVDWVLGNL